MNSPIDKSLFEDTRCQSLEVLLRYRDGKLNSAERHAVEKHLIDCPLCSDALEGLQYSHSTKAIEEINAALSPAVGGSQESNTRRYLTLAASVASIALLTWFAWTQFREVKDERMAINQKAAEVQPQPAASTMNGAADEQQTSSALQQTVPAQKQQPVNESPSVAETDVMSSPVVVSGTEMGKAVMLDSSPAEETAMEDKTEDAAFNASTLSKNTPEAVSAPSAAGAVNNEVVTSNHFNYNNSNVTYIDNTKVLNYDGVRGLSNSKSAQAYRAERKARTKNEVTAKSEQSKDESLSKNNYETEISAPLMLYNQGKYDAAIRGFDKLLASNPKDENARYYKAMCYYHLGKNDQAIDLLEPIAADSLSPFMEEAMYYLANSYANRGDKVPAYNIYNNIIRNNGQYNQKAVEGIKNLNKGR